MHTFLRRLRNAASKKKPRKMENQHLVSPSRQCSSTPVGFGQGWLSKVQFDNAGESPTLSWPGCSWFSFVSFDEMGTEGTVLMWCYWRHQECHGRAVKALAKWFSWNVANTFTFNQGVWGGGCIVPQGDGFEGNVAYVTVLFCISQK